MDSASMASLDCLPDDLLVQILSSLTIKQAASTSILAKRWRTLFAFRHTLDFDDTSFWHPEDRKHRRVDIRESFRDFVDRSLALQGGNNHLKKFSLKYLEILCSQNLVVDRWICDALEHNLSELHLLLDTQGRGSLPSKIFTTTTLVKLSLGTNLYLGKSVPSDASLPALKILFLDSVWIETEVFNNVFLPACPALEDLTVKGTPQQGFPDAISTKSVKRLTVAHNDGLFIPGGFISLDTPKLVDLYYVDYVRPESPHCNLDSLEKATLDLHFPEEDNQLGTPDPDVTDLMSGIRNIMTLHLTTSSAEVISVSCKGGLPVFNNLVELFFSSKKRGWKKLLPLLLERSPNLKTLVLSGLERCTYGRRRFVGVPISANNQVKVLRIMQCQGSASELKHIGHFLLKMEFLEVVMVYVAPGTMDDPSKVQQLTEDLLKLPTASSKLKIQVM